MRTRNAIVPHLTVQVVAAHDLVDGDFFALTTAEVGTGGWMATDVKYDPEREVQVAATAPVPGVTALLSLSWDVPVFITDGNDLRLQHGVAR